MLRVVHVHWKDPAFSRNGWMSHKHFVRFARQGYVPADTVGILAHEDEECVVILQTLGVSQVTGAVKITRSAIAKMVDVGTVDLELDIDWEKFGN